ncbi:MAG: S41 family peptidase [Anaerosomatales bacterium]|nr:S41 family peptidase [Anaerosomatales bacterium]MDT8434429.1 S41 family peptidase [Anaerosomatales bacterium]
MKRAGTYIALTLVGLMVLAAAFLGGVIFDQTVDWSGWFRTVPEPGPNIGNRVDEVRRLLEREALTPSSEDSMTAGSVRGLLESLDDPYAAYLDEKHFDYFNEQAGGEFFGVGINIAERDGIVYVVSVMEGTPAEAAGLQAEDGIVSIDGESRDRWDIDEVVTRVRGPEGTEVELGVRRADEDELVMFTITRAQIDIPNVMSRMVDDEVGYLRLLTFNQKSAEDLTEEIAELEAEGATSFVLDLRDNPGGLLSSAVEVASLFIEDGVIVRVEERDRPQTEQRARPGTVTGAPLVLLVNGNSASASEVLAGALQDYGRATLMGEQTFGKGSVQTVEQLSWGGGVKFTIAHYLTPQSRVIDGVGLAPDVVVEMELADQADDSTDIQLQRAIEEAQRAAR